MSPSSSQSLLTASLLLQSKYPKTTNIPMLYAYDTKSGETSKSSDQSANFRKRKFPRLAVTTFQPSSSYDNFPSTTSSNHLPFPFHTEYSPMEVEDTPLNRQINIDSNEQSFVKHRRRRADDVGSSYRPEHGSFGSVYRAPVSSSCYTTTATSCAADALSTPQFHHLHPSYPQGAGAQPEEFPYLRTQPPSRHTSPPRSTTVSPRELFDSFPLPIQPSPSLPLHQPRPSRRIPIVSLSQLASACEDTEPVSRRTSAAALKPRTESLPISFYPSNSWQSPYPNYDRDKVFFVSSTIQEDNRIGRVLQCSCGCMETYAVG